MLALTAGLATPFAQLHTLREQGVEMFTQELRLNGTINDSLDYMIGYYYYDSELNFSQRTNNVLQIPFGLPPGVPCAAAIPIRRTRSSKSDRTCSSSSRADEVDAGARSASSGGGGGGKGAVARLIFVKVKAKGAVMAVRYLASKHLAYLVLSSTEYEYISQPNHSFPR